MTTKTEYLPLITKLLEKTKDRKIEWKGTYESDSFICALEGEYSFEIERGKTTSGNSFRKLTMRDRVQGEVFVVRGMSPTSSSSTENDQLYEILSDLFEWARRIALDVDRKVNDISNILDKI